MAFAPDLYHGKVAEGIPGEEALGEALDANHLQAKAEIAEVTLFLNERAGQAEGGLTVIGFSLGVYYALNLAARRHTIRRQPAWRRALPPGTRRDLRAARPRPDVPGDQPQRAAAGEAAAPVQDRLRDRRERRGLACRRPA